MGWDNRKAAVRATLTDAEIAREARRIFRYLRETNARLSAVDAQDYALHHGARMERRVQKVPADIVEHFRRNGWLSRGDKPESFVLSEAGKGWLARADSTSSDPFQAQHQLRTVAFVKDPDGIAQRVEVNHGEDPLGWLLYRRVVGKAQYDAGERLRCDFTFARLAPRLGINLQDPRVLRSRAPAESIPDRAIAAGQSFRAAMRAVGPGLCDLLFDVCCDLKGLEDAESERGWPRRSAKVVLRLALDRLAEHYGIATIAPSHGKIRSWMIDPQE
jgi:hypothetical protein